MGQRVNPLQPVPGKSPLSVTLSGSVNAASGSIVIVDAGQFGAEAFKETPDNGWKVNGLLQRKRRKIDL
jgi:hypothetical protein